MPNSFHHTQLDTSVQPSERRADSLKAQKILLSASLAAVFLAGGPMQGGMGIFLVLSGIVLVALRPITVVPWKFWIIGFLVVLAASLSIFPSEWIGAPQQWSVNLRDIPGLVLPDRVSADPRNTLFWVLLLAFTVTIALYSLSIPVDADQMQDIALLAVLGCSLYAVLAWIAWQTGWIYPFFDKQTWIQASFGFFPNRNHTAGFLLTGAILSLGLIYRGMHGGRLVPALIAACCFALFASVLLFFSFSRGGLVFFIVGAVIWIVGLGKYRSQFLMVFGGAVFLLMAVLFLNSGSGLLERLKGYPSESQPAHQAIKSPEGLIRPEVRLQIARDTIDMIVTHPVTGTGLGTYALVYPFFADRSLHERATALHAESDWLTLCSEAGIPALLLALGCVVLLIARIPHLASISGDEWPLRWAFLSAFFAELLHGFVDVPLHKPELGWWVLLLGGIGFGEMEIRKTPDLFKVRIQQVLFIIGGTAMLCVGGMLVWAQWGGGPASPPYEVAAGQKKVLCLFGDGSDRASLNSAIAELKTTIGRHPLSHQPYYQLAVLLLYTGKNNIDAVKTLFHAEQALSPYDPDLAFEQGKVIERLDPLTTATYWNEALGRQLRLEQRPDATICRSGELYRSMIREAKGNQALLYRIPALAGEDSRLRLIWLSSQDSETSMIVEAVNDETFMNGLSEKEQGRLIELWWQRGDKTSVSAFLESHPRYGRSAISTRASALATSGQPEKACRLLIDTFRIPLPEGMNGSSIIRAADGDVPADPLAAAKYYMERGNEAAARRLLDELHSAGGDNQGEALRLSAVLEMKSGNWNGALQKLTAFLYATGQL